mgnify:CR=1 FL=1
MNTKKVLLIDEAPLPPELTLGIFDQCNLNIEVIPAVDGVEGVELAHSIKPDLILSEVVLESLDGFGVYDALKNDPATAETPFIFLTTQSMHDDKKYGLQAGADDYIKKPFDIKDLIRRSETLISKEWKKYESLYFFETTDYSVLIGQYTDNTDKKSALDCVVAQEGNIAKTKTVIDKQEMIGNELKRAFQNNKTLFFKLGNQSIWPAESLELKEPSLYNCLKFDDVSLERLPTIRFLETLITSDKKFLLDGYSEPRPLFEKYNAN